MKALPILLVFFVLLKAYVVAHYSLTTTGALVTAAPIAVLVGTVTAYLNFVLPLLAVATSAWLWRYWRARRKAAAAAADSGQDDLGDSHDGDVASIVFGVWLLCILFFPVPHSIDYFSPGFFRISRYILAVLVIATGAWVLCWAVTRWLLHRRGRELRYRWFLTAGVIALLIPSLNNPWLPAEVLVLQHSTAVQDLHPGSNGLRTSRYPVVFVISVDGQWTTVLDVKTRILLRLPTSSVRYRQVCHYLGQPPGTVPALPYVLGFRYHSPNRLCSRLVKHHAQLLDPLASPTGDGSPKVDPQAQLPSP